MQSQSLPIFATFKKLKLLFIISLCICIYIHICVYNFILLFFSAYYKIGSRRFNRIRFPFFFLSLYTPVSFFVLFSILLLFSISQSMSIPLFFFVLFSICLTFSIFFYPKEHFVHLYSDNKYIRQMRSMGFGQYVKLS